MRGERLAAPIFALLIVFSAVAGAGAGVAPASVSPVGTAQAQAGDGSGGACGAGDWFLTLVTGTLLTTDCKTAEDVSEEWNETDAIETRTQIHSQAGQLAAGNEQFLVGMDNALTDSNTIAFSKGEAAAVEVLANGGNISEAQTAANESIEDYYTTKQRNLLDRWDVNVQTIVTLNQRAKNTTGVDRDFVTGGSQNGLTGSKSSDAPGSYAIQELTVNSSAPTTSVSLINGSSRLTDQLNMLAKIDEGNNIRTHTNDDWFNSGTLDAKSDGYYFASTVKVRPTENLTSKEILDAQRFWSTYQQMETRSASTKEEVAVYVNESLGPAVQNGELNATSYVSPATLAQEYAQEYGNGTSYIRATAIAAYSGMDTPDLNETGSMTVTHDGTTYNGLLLSQEAPSGGWQSGETYDPALLSGLQMFAVAGDNGSIVELDGSFTVEKITGTSGDEISKATTVNVTYQTSNASANYTALQEQIRELNKQIEERQAQATTGPSETTTNDGLLDRLAALLGISAGAATVVVVGVAALAVKVYTPD